MRASPPPADLDVSYFSMASSMNLSIGARASLNEHLRHVQKYGLDVSTTHDDNDNDNDRHHHISNPLDDEWDRLVGSRDNSHINNSNNSSLLEDTILLEAATDARYESIEVMTNVSVDFFNSSRVDLLRTPKKNRSRRFNAVSTRGQESSFNCQSLLDDDDDCTDEDDESDEDGESPTMMRMFQQTGLGLSSARKKSSQDQEFASFSAVDISRISADGSEGGGGLRRSPDCSFQDHRSTIDTIDQSFLSHMEMLSPGRDFKNTSGVLSPRSSPPRIESQRRNFHDFSTPKRGQSQSSVVASKEKENAPTDYFNDVIGLSPIGSRIGDPSRNSKVPVTYPSHPNTSFSTIEEGGPSFLHNVVEAAPSEEGTPSFLHSVAEAAPSFLHNVVEAAPSFLHGVVEAAPSFLQNSFLQTSFLQNIDEAAESPIGLSKSRVSVVEYDRTHDSEISTLNSSSAGKKKVIGMSSSNRHFSPGSPLDTLDRRRYRTVVPSRVFMNGTDDFPEQYDSFSAPAPRSKPLLDSFDAALYRSGYSDPTHNRDG
jgi:hypothetical protein